MGEPTAMSPWGKYPNFRDIARFEYGRLLWKNPIARQRLLAHWENPDHPYSHRFAEKKLLLCSLLESPLGEAELDAELRRHNFSLRTLAREIPPVFGSI
jgi:hypothetical protein